MLTKLNNEKAIVSFVFSFALICFSIDLFAQGYPCGQYEICPSPVGTAAIREHMDRYKKLYERYGQHVDGQAALASESQTQSSDSCPNCGGNIRAIKIKISGEDSRKDGHGKTRANAKLTPAENEKYNGVGVFICPSTGIDGTVTLVKKGNGYIFIGSGHVVVPAKDEKIFSEGQMQKRFPDYAKNCVVALTDESGTVTQRFRLDIDRVKIGSFEPTNNRSGDYVIFNGIPMDEEGYDRPVPSGIKLNTNKIVIQSSFQKPVFGRLVGYHSDMNPASVKIKSDGVVKDFPSNTGFSGVEGLVGHNIDTQGASSGATILNGSGEAYAIHIGGDIAPGAEADWITNVNFAIPITQKILNEVNSI